MDKLQQIDDKVGALLTLVTRIETRMETLGETTEQLRVEASNQLAQLGALATRVVIVEARDFTALMNDLKGAMAMISQLRLDLMLQRQEMRSVQEATAKDLSQAKWAMGRLVSVGVQVLTALATAYLFVRFGLN